VGLSHTRRPKQDHVPSLLHEAQGGELRHQLAIQLRLEIEVELGQGLVHWVVGKPEPAAQATRFGGLDFAGQEPLQHLGDRAVGLGGAIQFGRKLLGRGTEPEVGEVLAQALIAGCLSAGAEGGSPAHEVATAESASYSARSRSCTCSPARRTARSITLVG
jgi:hypothetical protein